MSRRTSGGIAFAVAALIAVPGAAGAAAADSSAGAPHITRAEWAQLGLQQVPKQTPSAAVIAGTTAPSGVNPFTSLVPDPARVDWAYWKSVAKAKGRARAGKRKRPSGPLVRSEVEAANAAGQNDSLGTAELVAGFGTAKKRTPAVRLDGTLARPSVTPDAVASAEDDGAIPLANDTGLGAGSGFTVTDAVIGDGPNGSSGSGTGDFDYYKLSGLEAGQVVVADATTPSSELDSVLVLWDSQGGYVGFSDDGASQDSRLGIVVPDSGDYYLTVAGFPSLPGDPFNSGSGYGAGSEGSYHLEISVDPPNDVDFYSFDLKAGDVVGATVTGTAGQLALFDPSGRQVMGSQQDASFLYPEQSPLPGGGSATAEHVAGTAGRYTLRVGSAGPVFGDYQVTLEGYRSEERQEKGAAQTLFLDFDGARVNVGIFGLGFVDGVKNLSPLDSFLGGWGLAPKDKNALIDTIVATVKENLKTDLRQRGGNADFAVELRNSRDNADLTGQANVSRLVVGGSIAESGIPTIGIASSIDPGNFGHEDTGLILLDILSGPAGGFGDPSLNSYLTPESKRSNRIAFVGQALGNVISHEAGHFLGNWHVDQYNEAANLMDQGGNFPVLYGVGPDGAGGTADDGDVDFGEDSFNPFEGFSGTENTLVRTAFGLTTGVGFPR